MKKKDDILYAKKRYWFFSIRAQGTSNNLEREMKQRLDDFCLRHMNAKWAMNPRVCIKEGFATARVFVIMQNAMSFMSMKKRFGEAEFQLNLPINSVWQYLSCDDKFTKENLVYSENWTWDNISHGISQIDDNPQRPINITINIDNMFFMADEELKSVIIKSLNYS